MEYKRRHALVAFFGLSIRIVLRSQRATAAATKTGKNTERQIVGKAAYATTAISISASILLLLVLYIVDNFVQFGQSLPHSTQLRALNSAIPPLLLTEYRAQT